MVTKSINVLNVERKNMFLSLARAAYVLHVGLKRPINGQKESAINF